MIPAGTLNNTIEIERTTETLSASGVAQKIWATQTVLRAAVIQASVEEALAGFGAFDADTIVFRIRWRTDLELSDRVRLGTQAYEITKITELPNRKGLDIYTKAIT